jgi:chromosome segregation ATPase
LEYDRLKAELKSLEDEKTNSANEQQRLRNEISEMKTIVDQLQLKIRESKEENSRLELQKIKLQNFVKNFQDKNLEFNKVKQAIKGQLEYILADRRQLISMAVQAVIEILRADPQKFRTFYYNQSTVQPANNEEPLLVEAEQLYEKILVYNTNRVVTSLSDNISSVSTFTQQELCGQQAFHPDFEAIKNDSNDTMNPPL